MLVCSGVDSRKLGATRAAIGSGVGHVSDHVMAMPTTDKVLVTRAPARRCPGTRTKAKTLLINSCYTLVVMFRAVFRSDRKPLLGVCELPVYIYIQRICRELLPAC